MLNKIYIIDAVNFLFRAYYGIGPMTNGKGESVSALYGFIRSLQKLRDMVAPTHLVCVFDGPQNKKSRQALYADYKSHRKGAPEDLLSQFDLALKYCELNGISTLCVEGVEADDVMASIALWAKREGAESYLCSSDKDLAQLVDEKIFLLHPHKDYALVDQTKVEEIYGVKPSQIRDFLAITGDASDHIPGIQGMGPKTAVTLLQQFGSLENLYQHLDQVKGEKKQELLRTYREDAFLSQALVELNVDVKIPEELCFYEIKPAHTGALRQFFQEMNFTSFLKEQPQQSVRPQEKRYHLVDSQEDLNALFIKLGKEKEIGIDTETTDVNPFIAELVGIGFAVAPEEAWYVPCHGRLGKEAVVASLRSFFQKTQSSFYGHNIKYDVHVLEKLDIQIPSLCFDTMLASYVLDPQDRRHNLDILTLDRFSHVKIPIESLLGKGSKLSMQDVPIDKVQEYCCEDIDYTTRLKILFQEELKEKKLTSLFTDLEMPLLPILANMEKAGIYLEAPQLAKIGEHLHIELDKLTKKIFHEAKEEFNLNSPKQLSSVLFEKMGILKPKSAKSEFATSADVLEELAESHPIAGLILEYRSLEKLRSTYIESLPSSIHPKTGRIHCTFNQSVAATGRLSCQDPNLQNIPIRTKEGLAIRSCFKPQQKGWSFVGGDYSQIELRLLAHFSQDPELIQAFKSKEDIHAHTASRIFNLPITMITPEMRSQAKTVNFGILYGQGPFGLSKILHISHQEAAAFIKTYFEKYPGILHYLEKAKEDARKTGVATTFTGRIRPIPEIHNKNPSIRAAAERLAVNTPLQGTAADLIKKAMITIHQEIIKQKLRGFLILQVHDELIFEVPDEEISAFEKLVEHHMATVFKLKVPIEVHISVGKNWAEC